MEGKSRFTSNVECRTLHALALSYVKPKLPIEDFTYLCIKENLSYDDKRLIITAMDEFFRSSSVDMYEYLDDYLDDSKLAEIIAHYIEDMLANKVNPTFNMILKAFHVLLAEGHISPKYDMVILDECLPGYMYIDTSTGMRLMSSVYKSLMDGQEVKVKSFNTTTKEFEYKKALNPIKSENRKVLQIKTEGLNKLDCTPNHPILTQRGYVRADELIIGKDRLILDTPTDPYKNYSSNFVSSIEEIGEDTVYDFEVEDNHNFITKKSKYATGLVVHNCQDSTGVALEIFKLLDSPIKLGLGDEFQSIYQFMNLVNGFDVLKDTITLPLTRSFRCSTEIANRVQEFGLKYLSSDFEFLGTDTPKEDGKTAYVTLTNAGIINRINDLHQEGKSYTLTRKVSEIFACPLALVTASSGKAVFHKKYKFLEKEYKNYTMSGSKSFFGYLKQYVRDDEIESAIGLIMKFREKNINIFDVMNAAKATKPNPYILVSTAYSSKGLEFSDVYIEDDLNNAMSKMVEEGGPETEEHLTLCKVAYVAASRTRIRLHNCKYL